MQRKWKLTTYEACATYAEEMLGKLREDETFAAICNRAATLGLEVDCTYQHTYVTEGEIARLPVATYEGRVPRGYALVIWVDLVKDGYVVCCANKENPIQLSTSVTAAKHMNLLFSQRVIFLDYEDLVHNEPLFEMLEEYLDLAEEHGTTPSLFLRDGLAPTLPEGELGFVHRADISDGSFVEFAKGAYDGTVGADTSLYVATGAYMPYNLMLYTVTGKALQDTPITLTVEETAAYLDLLDRLPYEARQCENFSDLLVDGLELSAMTPTPRMAQYLDGLTYLRYKMFLTDVETLADFVRTLVEEEQPLTLIP